MTTPSSTPARKPETSPAGVPDPMTDELRRLKDERDGLAAQLSKVTDRRRRGGRVRRSIVAALVALFAILLPLTLTLGWSHRSVLDTDVYLKRVTPIAQDPVVTAAVSRQLTNQLYASLDPQKVIADALPPRASFLAAPIANGVKGFVQEKVDALLQTPQFQQIWTQANRTAHSELVGVLRGHSNAVSTTNGQVVLNLVPLMDAVLINLKQSASGLLGRDIKIPSISSTDLPAAACEKLSQALSRPLPKNCAQIALFPADQLKNAQRGVRAFDRGVLLGLILTPLAAIGALVLSRRRHRTLVQLTVCGSLGLVIVRRALMWLEKQVINTGPPQNKEARSHILHHVMTTFYDLTLYLLIGLLVVLLIALLTGPYSWARSMRHGIHSGAVWIGSTAAALTRGGVGKARDEATVAWVRTHVDLLRIAGVVVAVLILLIFGVSFLGFLVLAALLAGYEIWLSRLRPEEDDEAPIVSATAGKDVPRQHA